ncbi:MAG: hypothetical protein AAB588_06395 [Patescibacteria group bacterium]
MEGIKIWRILASATSVLLLLSLAVYAVAPNTKYSSYEKKIKNADSPSVDGHPFPDEKSISLLGKFFVTYTDQNNFREFAEAHLIQNAFCFPKIKKILEITPRLIDTKHVIENIFSSDQTMAGADWNSIRLEVGPDYNWKAVLSKTIPSIKELMEKDICPYPHELTHLFLRNLPLYGWLEEGLAEYVQYQIGDRNKSDIEKICLPQAFCEPYQCLHEGNDPTDYENLGLYPTILIKGAPVLENRNRMYYTGMCFWHEIETTYGNKKLKRVMKQLVKERRKNNSQEAIAKRNCSRTIPIIENGLGKKISQELLEKYGLTRNTTAAYGEYYKDYCPSGQ